MGAGTALGERQISWPLWHTSTLGFLGLLPQRMSTTINFTTGATVVTGELLPVPVFTSVFTYQLPLALLASVVSRQQLV